TSSVQIGRRLFVSGGFNRLSTPTGNAVIVNAAGAHVPGAFPRVTGPVSQVVSDGLGGFLFVGDFTSVGGQPFARFARVGPDRTVDPRYRVAADGPIYHVALAHGRIYLAGEFQTLNGAARHGLAALDAATGRTSAFGHGFNPEGRRVTQLSVSSMGIYVAGLGRLWGFSAATGGMLFERELWVNTIAATSARVYLGGYGYQRPVWAVDPLTGQDTAWQIGLTFLPISGTYSEHTSITALLVDGGRLYFAGVFSTVDQQSGLASVDATSGLPTSWRPWLFSVPSQITRLMRVGVAVAAITDYWSGRGLHAFDVATGALLAFNPQTFGPIRAIAAAPEGAVVGGEFDGIEGVARAGIASIDLDTKAIEPWTVTLPPFTALSLATDGTWIFGRTSDSRFFKIDPVSGAIVGEHRVSSGDVVLADMRVAGSELITAVSERVAPAQLGALSIADWSYRALPVTLAGGIGQSVGGFDVAGDTIYIAGPFATVNGQSRPYLAAVHRVTGEVLPWRPSPDAEARDVAASGGRVWVSGGFLRVGGLRRRGLAELDPVTGHALAWNPDVPVGWGADPTHVSVGRIEIGPDGLLYAVVDGYPRPFVSGQTTPHNIVFSPLTGRRLPWRPAAFGWSGMMADCMLVAGGCLRPAISSPTDLVAEQSGTSITLRWTLPTDGPPRSAIRLEVGSAAGRTDLLRLDLAPDSSSYTAAAPSGSYFARVRSLAGIDESLPTPDVSFAVGRPAAPLDVTAVTEGTHLTVQWTPPSTGAPAAYVLEAGSAEGARDLAQLPVSGGATSLTIDAPAGRYWSRLVSVDAAGARTAGSELFIDVAATANFCGSTPPEAPQGLSASVTGSTVTLTWQQPYDGPLPITQRVVAGTAPGLDNLGAIQVASDVMAFTTTAPPGTYDVRVLALNGCGGNFSNEVQVVVP
ncbi:MAG: hypothetical protein AB7H81_24490, partial [Vicinamibacterales bacterium]